MADSAPSGGGKAAGGREYRWYTDPMVFLGLGAAGAFAYSLRDYVTRYSSESNWVHAGSAAVIGESAEERAAKLKQHRERVLEEEREAAEIMDRLVHDAMAEEAKSAGAGARQARPDGAVRQQQTQP